MTTPTDRQIEAVEDVLRGLVIISGDSTWDMNYVARKVLTAAAEVGGGWVKQETHNFAVRYAEKMIKERDEIEAHTIERCAQVAERLFTGLYPHKDYVDAAKAIAAAIRALRDRL